MLQNFDKVGARSEPLHSKGPFILSPQSDLRNVISYSSMQYKKTYSYERANLNDWLRIRNIDLRDNPVLG